MAMQSKQSPRFEVSVSGRDDGTIEAVYIRFNEHKVHTTKVIVEDTLLIDLDRQREIVGIEILAPVNLSALVRLVRNDLRIPFRRFVKKSIPDDFLTAA